MTPKPVKIKYVDFWQGFDTSDDPIFHRLVPAHFNVEILNGEKTTPDILVYSVFGTSHYSRQYRDSVKVLYSAENLERFFTVSVNADSTFDELFETAHFAVTMHRIPDERHFRMPNYIRKYGYESVNKIIENRLPIRQRKSRFAAFIQKNCGVHYRNRFVKNLMRYKRVDCGGPCMNNMGTTVEDKIEFIGAYKFLLAFENSSAIGYVTEKLFDAFLGNTMPLYWGDPTVALDFNTRSFLNRQEYASDEAFIEKIIEVDNDPKTYEQMMAMEKIVDRDLFDPDRFLSFFETILKAVR